jgi:hypothetical protein
MATGAGAGAGGGVVVVAGGGGEGEVVVVVAVVGGGTPAAAAWLRESGRVANPTITVTTSNAVPSWYSLTGILPRVSNAPA